MSGIATAIIGSAVVGGVVASNSASKAAKAQQNAADKASNTELEMFNQNREDMQPWREAGTGALKQMTEGTAAGGDFNRDFTLADFTRDPGYDFRMQQGSQALERSAAARGGALSGGALKGITRYGQDFASGEYQNAYNRFNNDRTQRFNRLASLAGTGQTATRDVAQMGSQVAGSVANNIIGAGNSQASSYVGQGNAISGAAQSLGNFAMNQYFMNQMKPVTPAAPTASPTSTAPYWRGGYGGDMPVYG
jgi:hypothetical protein